MKVNKIMVLISALFPVAVLSAEKTIVCEPPQGSRIDYFTVNRINLKNETFLMGRDSVSGMRPRIVLAENGTDVSFILGDTETLKSAPKTANMKVVESTEDQISFVGKFNGAPIMASYYPKMAVLIYSQQSIWPGPDYLGARAAIFYSRCQLEPPLQT